MCMRAREQFCLQSGSSHCKLGNNLFGFFVYWSNNHGTLNGVLLLILMLWLYLELAEPTQSVEMKKINCGFSITNTECLEYMCICILLWLMLKAHTSSLMPLCTLENIILGLLMLIIMSNLTCCTNHLKNRLTYYCYSRKIYSLILFSVIYVW